MVRIHVKHGENFDREFLFDCPSISEIREIAENVIQISNLQLKIQRLVAELEPRLSHLHGDSKAISLSRALSEAKSYASKDQALHNRTLLPNLLKDHIQIIERELVLNYQLLGLSDSGQFQVFVTGSEHLNEDTTQLCWAGKELMREKKLCDYIGRNEKTKITIRLQSTVN
ncbi:uncharacterized protein LOC131167052 [Malania oleifera]|uniref:uncharacterized protein LOC131167052 n=1 Tax=Malania oleifera TaxID=397392 RepID=UPI0025AE6522|nr:uncharacterized protein LOC131167052 [Malania oleifera]XP_057981791.1 uncharacterized protein LOC131167052 [Malania oleifera]XP_057981792.1 uncharacterized protein LOC131167052 [Malania oleifera]XP_057981793.1 uncharacterized protein LOC131167052 [Malania oleifera]XP_057981794.1 uncharacterized protein LOC131167052 [Malania oleifera]XP_057981795.1 uncharacterized protein LOC131167052 [Malania oleifera]XP_057981796.1 uncharacterized protein LOC131167052 [Malania oleifera]